MHFDHLSALIDFLLEMHFAVLWSHLQVPVLNFLSDTVFSSTISKFTWILFAYLPKVSAEIIVDLLMAAHN